MQRFGGIGLGYYIFIPLISLRCKHTLAATMRSVVEKTRSDLMVEGFDPIVLDEIPGLGFDSWIRYVLLDSFQAVLDTISFY